MRRLRKILHQRGIQELDLAVNAKLSPYRLSRLLNNRSRIRAFERRRIARALGIPIEQIFGHRKRRSK